MSFVSSAKAFLGSLPVQRFHPVTLDALRHYNTRMLTRDISAGLTVGMVALPLAMAFGIASGVPPEAGIYTAIIAGFLISLLGGCRVQIGGPAGAFIVIIYGIIANYGLGNLLLATIGSGVILFLMGLFKLHSLHPRLHRHRLYERYCRIDRPESSQRLLGTDNRENAGGLFPPNSDSLRAH